MKFLRAALAVWLLSSSVDLLAQAWPSKPVRMLIPHSAGSSPDIMARMVFERLTKAFGQSFLVENRVGADGVIAAQQAARAPADGYNFFWGTNITLVSNLFLLKSVPYDADKDFTPVANIVDSSPNVIAVPVDLPARSIQELIALARSQPGKLSYGITFNLNDILADWLNKSAGIDIVKVSYNNNPQAVQDAVAGRTQVLIVSLSSVDAFVKSGKLRLVAVTGAKRFPLMPELPALTELYPGMKMEGWNFIVAPTGTPADIIQRMNREIDVYLKEPEFPKRLAGFGMGTSGAQTPQWITDQLRVEREQWRRIIDLIGRKPS